jgi:hypothetical protein
MKRKGINLVFEQVMLFLIGVAIFIFSFSAFNLYEYQFTDTIKKGQMVEVSTWIVSNLILVSEKSDEAETIINAKVPRLIGNENYKIELVQQGLNLTSSSGLTYIFSPLKSINQSYTLSGSFSTTRGDEFRIRKSKNSITIF